MELWCFLWSATEQTFKQTIKTPVIWDAIALLMTSLWCTFPAWLKFHFVVFHFLVIRTNFAHALTAYMGIVSPQISPGMSHLTQQSQIQMSGRVYSWAGEGVTWGLSIKDWQIHHRGWTMISKNTYAKQYDIITHPCPNFSDVLAKSSLKLGRGWVVASHIILWI